MNLKAMIHGAAECGPRRGRGITISEVMAFG